jgi:hypothetical protein
MLYGLFDGDVDEVRERLLAPGLLGGLPGWRLDWKNDDQPIL